jgi:hypothetical protein
VIKLNKCSLCRLVMAGNGGKPIGCDPAKNGTIF